HSTGHLHARCVLPVRRSPDPRFFLYASIAILAGIFLSVEHPTLIGESFEKAGLNLGTGYAPVCALFWGLSTVAGRGAMIGMPLRLAASLRVTVGTDLHDAHSSHLRKIISRFPLATSRSGAHDHSHFLASSSRLDFRRHPTSHLL